MYSAGIQLSGKNKPLIPPIDPIQKTKNTLNRHDFWRYKKMTVKQKREDVMKKIKNKLVDKRTIEYLKHIGFLDKNLLDV